MLERDALCPEPGPGCDVRSLGELETMPRRRRTSASVAGGSGRGQVVLVEVGERLFLLDRATRLQALSPAYLLGDEHTGGLEMLPGCLRRLAPEPEGRFPLRFCTAAIAGVLLFQGTITRAQPTQQCSVQGDYPSPLDADGKPIGEIGRAHV